MIRNTVPGCAQTTQRIFNIQTTIYNIQSQDRPYFHSVDIALKEGSKMIFLDLDPKKLVILKIRTSIDCQDYIIDAKLSL